MMALEIAMDEMAEKLGLDPVEFRARNDTQVDPENPERPFSARPFVECLRIGRRAVRWSQRDARPGRVREGGKLIGMGMASAFRNNLLVKSGARVRLTGEGRIIVETDMTDIGTGSYTIIGQTAAEMIGRPPGAGGGAPRRFPPIPVSAGFRWPVRRQQCHVGVYAACVKLREDIARRLGFNSLVPSSRTGRFAPETARRPLRTAAAQGGAGGGGSDRIWQPHKTHQQSTFGSHFVEVAVDPATGEVRVRRMLAVCAAGRILNPKSARSQVIGAMNMGVGAALMEELKVDTRRGFFVNHDLAGYEVPVHADIPHQEVIFLDETDPMSSPMKAKGVGELGICGVAAAVANAIYNATGVRVRDYPITWTSIWTVFPSRLILRSNGPETAPGHLPAITPSAWSCLSARHGWPRCLPPHGRRPGPPHNRARLRPSGASAHAHRGQIR